MTTILVMLYAGAALLLFKYKILKVRPFPIAGVVLGGILIIGSLVVTWRQVAPMSAKIVTVQYVVQLVPYVKGACIKIHAKANQLLRKGDLYWRSIQSRPSTRSTRPRPSSRWPGQESGRRKPS